MIAVSDAAGNALVINRYDESGIPQGTNLGGFQYTGQVWLAELGMYYYKGNMVTGNYGDRPVNPEDAPSAWANAPAGASQLRGLRTCHRNS